MHEDQVPRFAVPTQLVGQSSCTVIRFILADILKRFLLTYKSSGEKDLIAGILGDS